MTFSGEWTRVAHLSDETGFVVAITAGNFLHQLIMLLATLSILAPRTKSWQSDSGNIASFQLIEFPLGKETVMSTPNPATGASSPAEGPSPPWPTTLPVFQCPPDCGLCCEELLVECDAIDVLREPRIQNVAPLKKTDRSLPVIDNFWLLAGVKGCPFLDHEKRCGIYTTRPSTCVGFPAGGKKCTQLRTRAGLPPLQGMMADGSMIDRLTAELKDYEDV
jgi:Fe-S-cluster containining protein